MRLARRLEDEKILTPTAYLLASGRKIRNKTSERGEYAWETSTIKHILANRQYTGCTVNLKSSIISYKVHKKVLNSEDDWQIIYMYSKKHNLTKAADVRNMKAEIERNKRRISEIDTMIEGLYEANVLGKITDERFSKMMGKYEAQQKTLIEETANLERALEQAEQDKVDLRVFLETIRKCTDIKELTPALVNRLIQRIEVHKSEKVDGRKRVKLDIYFTAVGLIDIPDENELREMMEEIRRSA